MTKNALLYEIRGIRQRHFLLNNNRLNQYVDLENLTSNEASSVVERFHHLCDNGKLSSYKLLMLHKSDIDISRIKPICQENNIALILFSGGISQTIYTDSFGFPYLKINSKDFYSENLFGFLDNFHENIENPNLLQLAYGEKWKLSIYLKMKQAIRMLAFEKNKIGEWREEWEKYEDLYSDIHFNELSKTAFNDLSVFPEKESIIEKDKIDSLFNSWESNINDLINPYFI